MHWRGVPRHSGSFPRSNVEPRAKPVEGDDWGSGFGRCVEAERAGFWRDE